MKVPKYSPDGKYIAYRMQIRSGYESDLWRLAVRERATGQLRVLTERLDRWVNDFTWSPDSAVLFFTIEDHGHQPLLMVPADGNGAVRTIAQGPTTIDDVQLTRDGRTMIYTEQSGSKPAELQKRVSGSTSSVRLDGINEGILNACQLTPLETMSVDSEDGKKVESFIVKPPGFDACAKISRAVPDPWRSARCVGGKLELSLESAGVRRCRVRSGDAESAWLGWLWPGIYGCGQLGLGRRSV